MRRFFSAFLIVAGLLFPASFGSAFGTFNSKSGGMDPTAMEYLVPSSGSLTSAQVTNTIVSNYGQGALLNVQQLPAPVEGMIFNVVIGTTQSNGPFALQAGASDKICLDGVAGDDNGFVSTDPVIGTTIHFMTFKTGASSYDWLATVGSGTWTAGGELNFAYEDGNTIISESGDNISVE